jgi:uncharacterized protein YndB with AHSA1/START domain
MTEKATATLEASAREIVSARVFDAPRELVFRAFTDPDDLKHWWGPKGFTNTFREFDPRPGGVWSFIMHGPDGTDYPNKHVFVEVVKPEKIALQHLSSPKFQMTITLAEAARKTRLTWRMLFETAEVCAKMKPLCVDANEQNFDRLAARLAIMAAERPFVIERLLDAPRDKVWKAWTECERLGWWGPKGVTIHDATLDLQPGGTFHYRMRTAEGTDMWGKWIIREIVPPERLVFVASFSDKAGGLTRHPLNVDWPLEVLTTVTFAEKDGKTRLTVHWLPINATDAERKTFDASHEVMRGGWTGTLDRLAEYLARP